MRNTLLGAEDAKKCISSFESYLEKQDYLKRNKVISVVWLMSGV